MSKQPSVWSFMGIRFGNERANNINELTTQIICRDFRSLQTVNDPGFIDPMSFIESNFVMPFHTHIIDIINAQYLSVSQKVCLVLANCRNMSLSTDSWQAVVIRNTSQSLPTLSAPLL